LAQAAQQKDYMMLDRFRHRQDRDLGIRQLSTGCVSANSEIVPAYATEETLSRRRPVAMPVNGGTRSGREILAFGFKKYRLGEVIGTSTEGAVLAATAFFDRQWPAASGGR
jgi:hypothetical protein